MAEKQATREKARAVIVQISAGELDDLRIKVSSLQAQVDSLKGQLAKASYPGGTAAPRHVNEIELGMTKAEVKAFIEQHRYEFQLVAIHATNGVSKSVAEVKVKESSQATVTGGGQRVVRRGSEGADLAGTGRVRQVDGNGSAKVTADGTRQVEVTTNTGKREVMEIARLHTVRRVVGSHTGSFGQVHDDYGDVAERTGTITVTLDDDVVTGVDAN